MNDDSGWDYTSIAVCDTESNGFVMEAAHVWQANIKDFHTGETWSYQEQDIPAFIDKLNEYKTFVAHNSTKHDIPLLAKIYPDHPITAKNLDSCILSQLFRPDRPSVRGCKGTHSLEAHGILMGRHKPGHEDWSKWSPEMEHRCSEDVEINVDKLQSLFNEKAIDESQGIDWDFPMRLEHTVAEIISQSEANGWLFDKEAADKLLEQLDKEVEDIDKELIPMLPNRCVCLSTKAAKKDGGHILPTKQIFSVKTGHYHANVCKYWGIEPESALDPDCLIENGLATEENPGGYCKVEFVRLDLDSNAQTIDFLLSHGWEPTEYTPKTDAGGGNNPKLTEDSFASITSGVGQLVARRRIIKARRTTIKNYDDDTKGWYNLVRDDGKITPVNNTQGTPTGRSRHSGLVNVPKADDDVPYGKECRDLFIAEDDSHICGADASGLEARMLAHFIDDENLTYQILNGDIHSYNQELAGLETRDQAKKFYYAFLYGGGDAKIGSIIGGDSEAGKGLKETFFKNLPKLKALIEALESAAKRGYIIGLDGRRIPIRSPHAALNCLLQGGGAVVMKVALCYLQWWLKCSKIGVEEVQLVTFYHDEFQQQVRDHWIKERREFESKESAEIFTGSQGNIWSAIHKDDQGIYHTEYSPIGELTVKAIRQAGIHFNLKCPLDAEYKCGRSWKETH